MTTEVLLRDLYCNDETWLCGAVAVLHGLCGMSAYIYQISTASREVEIYYCQTLTLYCSVLFDILLSSVLRADTRISATSIRSVKTKETSIDSCAFQRERYG